MSTPLTHVLFTGGGTAGHVVPALPVIDALLAQGIQVSYIGSRSGLEQELLAERTVTYHGVATGKLRRYASMDNVKDVFNVLRGVWQSFAVLRQAQPQVVFSKGGFVSFPVVFAAWLRRIPVVAHESDLSPGLANRLAGPFTSTLCVNFAGAQAGGFRGRVVHTGTPVRSALLAGDAAKGRAFVGAQDSVKILLVTGGSLGADALNEAIRRALDELTQRFFVVHLCGRGRTMRKLVRDNYVQYEFLDEQWGDVLAAADLVISRAGANTLYELLTLRKPNVLVPLPRHSSRGDQIENAAFAKAEGYSLVISEDALTTTVLLAALENLQNDPIGWQQRLGKFAVPDAVASILNVLANVVTEKQAVRS